MALMIELIDSETKDKPVVGSDGVYKVKRGENRSMVGRNRSLDQIPQQNAGKSSISEGAATTVDNVVVLKIDLG